MTVDLHLHQSLAMPTARLAEKQDRANFLKIMSSLWFCHAPKLMKRI